MNVYIRDVLDALTSSVGSLKNTVDKLEYGSPDSLVTGVAVTFLACQEVVEKAKELGVNLIVSHEGMYYSHWDRRQAFSMDPIYRDKCRVLEEGNIAVFRYHDYIHKFTRDGIMEGLLHSLGWKNYEIVNEPDFSVLEIPESTLQGVILYMKERLNIPWVRYIGDLQMPCRRIGLFVGYRGGGDTVIPLVEKENLDVVIYGEGPEWETPEYIRDAVAQGKQKALVVLGHAESEMPGMEYLAQWLQAKFPSIPVHFVPQKPVFQLFQGK